MATVIIPLIGIVFVCKCTIAEFAVNTLMSDGRVVFCLLCVLIVLCPREQRLPGRGNEVVFFLASQTRLSLE